MRVLVWSEDEVLVILLDVVRIILARFPLVHRVEVEARIVGLDWLEEGSEGVLNATFTSGQRHKQCMQHIERTI